MSFNNLFTLTFNLFLWNASESRWANRLKNKKERKQVFFSLWQFPARRPRSSCDLARAELGGVAPQGSLGCHGPACRGHRRVRPEGWEWAPGHAPACRFCTPAAGALQQGAALDFRELPPARFALVPASPQKAGSNSLVTK
jgi:hypothetical protein